MFLCLRFSVLFLLFYGFSPDSNKLIDYRCWYWWHEWSL